MVVNIVDIVSTVFASLLNVTHSKVIENDCVQKPIIDYIVGLSLCIGSTLSYSPQFYSMMKAESNDGISEPSVLALNIGSLALALNAMIFNWWRWSCFKKCDVWLCTGDMLSFYQILIGYIMVVIMYAFVLYYNKEIPKIFKQSTWKDNTWKDCIIKFAKTFAYVFVYLITTIIFVLLLLAKQNDKVFMVRFADALGIIATVFSCIVWIPQIIQLAIFQEQGNLNIWMFILQAPGNIVIIIFQAVLYKQHTSTWISYLMNLIQQVTIIALMVWIRYKPDDDIEISFDDEERHLLSAELFSQDTF